MSYLQQRYVPFEGVKWPHEMTHQGGTGSEKPDLKDIRDCDFVASIPAVVVPRVC